MNLLLAASPAMYRSGQGGGVSIHFSALAVVALCAWALIREYRVLTAPRRAEKARLRAECARHGHEWGDEFPNGVTPTERCRNCTRCGRQQHTSMGRWPEEA